MGPAESAVPHRWCSKLLSVNNQESLCVSPRMSCTINTDGGHLSFAGACAFAVTGLRLLLCGNGSGSGVEEEGPMGLQFSGGPRLPLGSCLFVCLSVSQPQGLSKELHLSFL